MDLLLKANRDRLLTQYTDNLEAVLALQGTLIHDILPSVTDELEFTDDAESTEWATEWLQDTCRCAFPLRFFPLTFHYEGSLFQILRVRDPQLSCLPI